MNLLLVSLISIVVNSSDFGGFDLLMTQEVQKKTIRTVDYLLV